MDPLAWLFFANTGISMLLALVLWPKGRDPWVFTWSGTHPCHVWWQSGRGRPLKHVYGSALILSLSLTTTCLQPSLQCLPAANPETLHIPCTCTLVLLRALVADVAAGVSTFPASPLLPRPLPLSMRCIGGAAVVGLRRGLAALLLSLGPLAWQQTPPALDYVALHLPTPAGTHHVLSTTWRHLLPTPR